MKRMSIGEDYAGKITHIRSDISRFSGGTISPGFVVLDEHAAGGHIMFLRGDHRIVHDAPTLEKDAFPNVQVRECARVVLGKFAP